MEIERKVLKCFNPTDIKLSSFDRRSGIKSIGDYKEASYLQLAHLTTSTHLESIKRNGLLPNSISNYKINDNLQTDSVCVYLSTTLDKYYSSNK